jgi:uncharacterized protein
LTTASASPARHAQKTFRQRVAPRVAKTARWLHIYLSMVSFAIILFFAVTGLTLNHPDWFSGAVKNRLARGTLDKTLLAAPSQRALADTLAAREHLHGNVDDFRVDDSEITLSFKAPGYSADATIDRQRGTYSVVEVRDGFVAVINDLHKGRDAGRAWSLVIDVSAVLLTCVSLTGLVILWFIYRRRSSGLLICAAGFALCLLIYRIFVP